MKPLNFENMSLQRLMVYTMISVVAMILMLVFMPIDPPAPQVTAVKNAKAL